MPQQHLAESILIRTRLRRPHALGRIVARPRLLALLDRGADSPLTIVAAPTGYGKTTLVALWLDSVTVPWAWYSIDAHDNSLAVFAAYLYAALDSAYPGCGKSLYAVLQSPISPQVQQLVDLFIADLAALPGKLILVLDDYQEVTQSEIHDFLSQVVQKTPVGVNIVVLTRSSPPLRLPRLRAHQRLVEVRAAQLRFTHEEARSLINNALQSPASPEIVDMFAERTEGWAVGLQLAAISMRDSSDAEAFARKFARSNNLLIVDYLVGEVLDRLPAPERTKLLTISILQRFCAPLLDAMISEDASRLAGNTFLDRLREMNLFLTALDDDGIWYRFHHLFADILRHRLQLVVDAETLAHLHTLASRWFEANSFFEEAILHAVEAGDTNHATQLVEAEMETLLDAENWRTLEYRLSLLPKSSKKRPGLLVARAWVEQFRLRPAAIFPLVEEAENRLADAGDDYSVAQVSLLRGAIYALRAVACQFTGQSERSLQNAKEALSLVSPERLYTRGISELTFIWASARLGTGVEAIEQANMWLRQQSGRPDSRTFRILLGLVAVHYDRLDLVQLHETVTLYRDLAKQAQRPLSIAWTSLMLGWIHYQRNEATIAEGYFTEVVEHSHEAHVRASADCWIGLCLSLQAQGRQEEARRQALLFRTHLISGGQVGLVIFADALMQYLNLLDGQPVSLNASYVGDLREQQGLDIWVLPASVWIQAQIRNNVTGGDLDTASEVLATCRSHLPPFPSCPSQRGI